MLDTMRHLARWRIAAAAIVVGIAMLTFGASVSAKGSPTCSDVLNIDAHGQHVVGDYVTGVGHDTLEWPPAGGVGGLIPEDGPPYAGGPGPGWHFDHGVAPGASFCIPQSKSPGDHVP